MAVTPVKGARSFPDLASDRATLETATITTAVIATSTLTTITGRTLTLTATAAGDEIVKVNMHASQTAAPVAVFTAGEANAKVRIASDGKIEFGAGGASAVDTNIYRSAANTLRTDDTFIHNGDVQISDAWNVILASTTGTKIGTATTQKLGFWNATPVVRPSAFTQTYATADKTHANPTATTVTNAFGTADGTYQDTSATSAAIANNFQEASTSINALIADVADVKQLCNSIIDDLQSIGLFA